MAGCKRLPPPPEGLPKLYPCKITVTFGGEAIEGVRISLVSTEPNYKWKSGGSTNKNGVAEMRTSFAYSGVPSGKFTIAFDKIEDSFGDTVETMTPMSLIPLKYRPDKSTEIVEIKEGKNEFTFTLDGGKERLPVPKGLQVLTK
ncbi:MAG: hypothetical protein LBH59_03775 [Planctomycetaceae bacterium]|nr:hypothetical protein [Planctomycetaceae bacterium]